MKSNSTIFLIITALILAGGAYWYFSTQDGNQVPLATEMKEGQPQQTQFKTLVAELNAISLDSGATSIFSNPNFTALTDLATPVTHEDSGRPDPFAPLPGVSVK